MKTATILMLGMVSLFTLACHHEQSNTSQPKVDTIKTTAEVIKTEADSNQIVFENLDQILSPFEDMVEFALDKNDEGILNSLNKVEKAVSENLFTKNLTPESIKLLSPKIEILNGFIKQKNYEQIALTATDIFEYNISNFVDTKKIENQIRIEHLDYLGFKILSMLNQEKIDWKNIQPIILGVQKEWITLSPQVKDNNLKDSFDYLFKGLQISVQNKDTKMGAVLASMDLSLVDVLENSF